MNGIHSSEQEPYRATKMWNEIIYTFCSELPRGKHRRHIRQYNNCFSGSEAVTWLQLYLKSNHNFGPIITRNQATLLLQKFHKSGVFEDVRGYKNTREAFQDDGRLYALLKRSPKKLKMLAKSPLKVARPPLAFLENDAREKAHGADPFIKPHIPIQRHMQDAHKLRKSSIRKRFEGRGNNRGISEQPFRLKHENNLTIFEVQEVWKESVASRLQALLKVPSLDEVLDIATINAQNLIHNSYRIGKSGVVSLLDKTEELPHWVTSAMKCLVNWPKGNGSDSCLPRYEGFENDVFRVIVEYFSALQSPLLTYDLFHLFITIFIRGEYFESGGAAHLPESNMGPSSQMVTASSIENLMNTITNPKYFQSTPVANNDGNKDSDYIHYSMIPILKMTPVVKTCLNCELPPDSCYETAFESETPITRIVPRRKFHPRTAQTSDQGYIDMTAKQNVQLLSVMRRSTSTRRSTDDLNSDYVDMAPAFDANRSEFSLKRSLSTDTVCTPAFTRNAKHFMRRSERRSRSPVESHRGFATVRRIKRDDENRKNAKNAKENVEFCGYVNHGFRNQSQEDIRNISSSQSGSSLYYSAKSFIEPSPILEMTGLCGHNESQRSRLSSNQSGSNQSWEQSVDSLSNLSSPSHLSSDQFPFVTDVNESMMLEAFQLGCLLLPTVNRRQLHLLLRVINKMSGNCDLILESRVSNKEFALKELSKCILHPENKEDYDEMLIMRILSVLLHYCETIFRPHEGLKVEVEKKLRDFHQIKRIPINGPVTFCDRISLEEFETQKQTAQTEAMSSLLESIIADEQLSSKEKSKKLIQFKQMYPEIYHTKFPDGNHDSAVMRPRLKSSKSQILTRLKSIRI